ncbi:hypothetical protein I4U23_012718 [Adineta vaga]|nr:hypothetical protein I4U23_012718 [Adineta vaga]
MIRTVNSFSDLKIQINMSSNDQNIHLGAQAGSIGQGGGAFSERGRAAENAFFHAQESEQLDALKRKLEQQQKQQQQQGNQSK